MLDLVQNLRWQHHLNLQEMIEDTRSLVDNLEQQQTLEVQREAARHLKNWLNNNGELDLATLSSPEYSLMSAINSAHPSSLRASVRRQGDWYNLDYSHQLSYGARIAAANVVGRKLNSFSDLVDLFLKDDNLEEAYGLLRQAHRVVNAGAESLFKKCEIEGHGIHIRDMEPSNDLWNACDSEWGMGPGYRDRVFDHHKNWFDEDSRNYRIRIQNLIQKEWKLILGRSAGHPFEKLRPLRPAGRGDAGRAADPDLWELPGEAKRTGGDDALVRLAKRSIPWSSVTKSRPPAS